jgi:hypothetical protein
MSESLISKRSTWVKGKDILGSEWDAWKSEAGSAAKELGQSGWWNVLPVRVRKREWHRYAKHAVALSKATSRKYHLQKERFCSLISHRASNIMKILLARYGQFVTSGKGAGRSCATILQVEPPC